MRNLGGLFTSEAPSRIPRRISCEDSLFLCSYVAPRLGISVTGSSVFTFSDHALSVGVSIFVFGIRARRAGDSARAFVYGEPLSSVASGVISHLFPRWAQA